MTPARLAAIRAKHYDAGWSGGRLVCVCRVSDDCGLDCDATELLAALDAAEQELAGVTAERDAALAEMLKWSQDVDRLRRPHA